MRKEKIFIAFSVCIMGMACQKEADQQFLAKNTDNTTLRSSISRLSYGEDMFYVSDKKSNNKISPKSMPDFDGHFTAIPSGLSLDKKTGEIDLSNSLGGQPYKIFYVNKKGILVDSVRISIAGLDYLDGVYNSEKKGSKFGEKSTAIYSGDESKPITSNFFNSFVVSTKDTDDEIEEKTGLTINKRDGSIDLKKSKTNGIFGATPANGSFKELVIKYRLADKSVRKLNKQKIKVYYFEDESKIPQSIKNILEERQRIRDRVNAMPLPGHSAEGDSTESTEDELNQFSRPVRPPLIIVT